MKSQINIVLKITAVIIMTIIFIIGNSMLDESKEIKIVIDDEKLLKSNEGLIVIKANVLNQTTEDKIAITPTKSIKELKIVYDNLTIEQLTQKLDRIMFSTLTGKGELFANYALQMGVDPYIALAIVFQETGCYYGNCSYLVRNCNNIGGMKGGGNSYCPGTGYAYFNNIDEGIIRFINNLSYGYFGQGLVTPELMNRKYAEDQTWAYKVNNYVNIIRNS